MFNDANVDPIGPYKVNDFSLYHQEFWFLTSTFSLRLLFQMFGNGTFCQSKRIADYELPARLELYSFSAFYENQYFAPPPPRKVLCIFEFVIMNMIGLYASILKETSHTYDLNNIHVHAVLDECWWVSKKKVKCMCNFFFMIMLKSNFEEKKKVRITKENIGF